MEFLVEYFNNIPSAHRSAILLGGLTFFLLLEQATPLLRMDYKKWSHLGQNLVFTLTTVIVNFALAFMLLWASELAVKQGFGILQWLSGLPLWAELLLGLMILDFVGAYVAHWAQHSVKWMWQFHLVHHTDRYVDTTSANRHHPGESVIRVFFTTAAILIAGAPFYIVMLYQSLSALLSQFNHANIRLPRWFSNAMGWIIVTPDMHRVHHHYVLPYTDTNYGNIFSIWDRLLGTYSRMNSQDIVFGIDTHMDPEEHSRLSALFRLPFMRYRPPVGAKFEERTPPNHES